MAFGFAVVTGVAVATVATPGGDGDEVPEGYDADEMMGGIDGEDIMTGNAADDLRQALLVVLPVAVGADVEAERTLDVGDLEVDVADAGAGRDRCLGHAGRDSLRDAGRRPPPIAG